MIVGYHVIFGAYGFWLPNDPRGSWSDFVGSWELLRYGPATKTFDRRSHAYDEHDRSQRIEAKKALKYPEVNFTGIQARAVGRGFANYIKSSGLKVFACAILPDHVHLVVGKPHILIERIVVQLKGDATQQLVRENIHPLEGMQKPGSRAPKCWARGEWKVYLDPEDVRKAIEYVEENPVKEGKPRQKWSFVVPI